MSVPVRVPRHRHSPLVRRLAREAGIDLERIAGTGPAGRVRPADIVAAPPPAQTFEAAAGTAGVAAAAVAATTETAAVSAEATAVTAIIELDLGSGLGGAGGPGPVDSVCDRGTVLAAVTHALLNAVRQQFPVTDVEVVSPDGSMPVRNAHNLTRAALASRIGADSAATPLTASNGLAAPCIAVLDLGLDHSAAPAAAAGLRTRAPRPGELLTAAIGPVEVRPIARPGPTGRPDITFRPTALLALSARQDQLDDQAIDLILSTLVTQLAR